LQNETLILVYKNLLETDDNIDAICGDDMCHYFRNRWVYIFLLS